MVKFVCTIASLVFFEKTSHIWILNASIKLNITSHDHTALTLNLLPRGASRGIRSSTVHTLANALPFWYKPTPKVISFSPSNFNLNKKVCTKSKIYLKYLKLYIFQSHAKKKLRQFPIQENYSDCWHRLSKIPKLLSHFRKCRNLA